MHVGVLISYERLSAQNELKTRAKILSALCVDICKNNQTFKTIVLYNPPRSNKVEFVNMMDKLLENLSSSNRSVIICGDMNLDIMKNNLLSRNYEIT